MSSDPQITLHWLSVSRARRTLWLLEELQVPYNVVPYYRVKGRSPPDLQNIHPLGKSPVIEVKTAGGTRVLAESGHISEYLIQNYDKHNRLTPASRDLETDVQYYTHLAEGSLQPPMTAMIFFSSVERATPWYASAVTNMVIDQLKNVFAVPETLKVLDLLENDLSKVAKRVGDGDLYLVGDKISGADIMIFWHIKEVLLAMPVWKKYFHEDKYPQLMRWVRQLQTRPAYKRMLAREKLLKRRPSKL